MTFGVGNLTRDWGTGSRHKLPALIWYKTTPIAPLMEGFSDDAPTFEAEDDYDAVYDTTQGTPDAALYPVTNAAKHVEEHIWPLVLNVFRMGLGSRATVSFSEFMRYTTMVAYAYALLYNARVINHLAYHFDWSVVHPHTAVTPTHIFEVARLGQYDDVSMNQKAIPLMQRLESKLLFPAMGRSIRRTLDPMLLPELGSRLYVPLVAAYGAVSGYSELRQIDSLDDVVFDVADFMNYVEVELHETDTMCKNFLPYPAAVQPLWDVSQMGLYDVDRSTGLVNSGLSWRAGFDNSALFNDRDLCFINDRDSAYGVSSAGVVPFLTRGLGASLGEIKNTTLYISNDVASGSYSDNYRLLTWALTGNFFPGTSNGYLFARYASANETLTSTNDAINVLPSRFVGADNAGQPSGFAKPGFNVCVIEQESIARAMDMETERIFHTDQLRQLTAISTGALLRTVRDQLIASFRTT